MDTKYHCAEVISDRQTPHHFKHTLREQFPYLNAAYYCGTPNHALAASCKNLRIPSQARTTSQDHQNT